MTEINFLAEMLTYRPPRIVIKLSAFDNATQLATQMLERAGYTRAIYTENGCDVFVRGEKKCND